MSIEGKFRLATASALCGALLLLRTMSAYAQTSQADDTQQEQGSRSPVSEEGNDPETMLPHLTNTRFWLSGQANVIFQAHPPFHSPYAGKNSLDPRYESATSRVLTLFSGMRLNDPTELLLDVEETGWKALSTGLGLAGFTNLDIVRNPTLSKAPYAARAMIHKVIALSKDKVENERSALSLFDELPRRRLEVRFGKFSMVDFFDVNSVGSDTHFQFTNWTVR